MSLIDGIINQQEYEAGNKKEVPPYSHNEELNVIVTDLMKDWDRLVRKAKRKGMDIRFAPDTDTMELYFNEDYPDTLLVDKHYSCRPKQNTIKE